MVDKTQIVRSVLQLLAEGHSISRAVVAECPETAHLVSHVSAHGMRHPTGVVTREYMQLVAILNFRITELEAICGTNALRQSLLDAFVRATAQADAARQSATPAGSGDGPGSQLKRLLAKLAKFGIRPAPGCKCNQRAAIMDARGPDWCEAHIDEIVGWLREEAQRAHLPFLHIAGWLLVRKAIKLARAAQNPKPVSGRLTPH